MMYKLWMSVYKEFLLLKRDFGGLIILFVMPLVLIITITLIIIIIHQISLIIFNLLITITFLIILHYINIISFLKSRLINNRINLLTTINKLY
jgi:hypothetical protein